MQRLGIVLPAHKRKAKILEGSTVFVKPEPSIFEGTHIVATRMGLDKGDVCEVKPLMVTAFGEEPIDANKRLRVDATTHASFSAALPLCGRNPR